VVVEGGTARRHARRAVTPLELQACEVGAGFDARMAAASDCFSLSTRCLSNMNGTSVFFAA
jgi:hypothetical protein